MCKVLKAHAAPADQTKEACATATAMPTPSAPPVNERKSAGAVRGEPEDGPRSLDIFDPGRDPDGIVEDLMCPSAMRHQLELFRGEWLEPGQPFPAACSLCASPLRECSSGGRGSRGSHVGARRGSGRACGIEHMVARTWW